ncbi:MAG: hypothetical protein OC190_05245 [Novosphingobium aromaticivorans]|nr:hypothetical protein [Novosphingobium aromaticivorans]
MELATMTRSLPLSAIPDLASRTLASLPVVACALALICAGRWLPLS